MKHFYRSYLRIFFGVATTLFFVWQVNAQQVPDPGFEDWSGAQFDGKIQAKYWNASNVEQVGFKFNLVSRVEGRSGYGLSVADTEVGAFNITEIAPGYVTLGKTWQYLESVLKVSEATGGVDGGISFSYRPDSMVVWIKRTGANVSKEPFKLLFYSWSGTAIGTSYKGKAGGCTSITHTDEESDIRQSTNANDCTTKQYATQVAEGLYQEMKEYADWTRISVPIKYFVQDLKPEKCNIILSAANYPNKRSSAGLYAGNTLVVDDVELIYNSTIDELLINDTKVRGFSATTTQFTKANEKKTYSPAVEDFALYRSGRKLTSSEYSININGAEVDNDKPVLITVTSEDGKSKTVYEIKFTSTQSSNFRPESITYKLGDTEYSLPNWNANAYNYDVSLPYGTTQTPQIVVVKSESTQTENITQPTGPNGTAKVVMTAQNGSSQTYTINFSVAQLTDNTLNDIMINGESLIGFSGTKNNYDVELPLGTTTAPNVTWTSNYAAGEQTITLTSNNLSGSTGKATITVQVPGNKNVRTYTLNYLVKASSYAYLADLKVGGKTIEAFIPSVKGYFCDLPMGTTAMPEITYVLGQSGQKVTVDDSGINNLSGDYKITVVAEDGTTVVYYITFTLLKSSNVDLAGIYVNDILIDGFDPIVTDYRVEVDASRTDVSIVTALVGEDGQTLSISKLSGPEGTATVKVTAADGKTRRIYTIEVYQNKSTDNSLREILVDGLMIDGFEPAQTEYTYVYQGKKPTVTYTVNDPTATATSRDRNGVVTITVTAQDGSKRIYYVTLEEEKVELSDYAYLDNIYVDGVAVDGFAFSTFDYTISLSPFARPTDISYSAQSGVSVASPAITWNTRVNVYKAVITVTAEDGTTKNTYTLNFVEGQGGNKNTDATLQSLLVDGVVVEGFDPSVLNYQFTIPAGGSVPTVGATATDSNAKVAITQSPSTNGQAQVKVTAEDGITTKAYTIQFNESTDPRSTDATLKSLSVDLSGKWSKTFAPTITDYTYTLPIGTTQVPQVNYELSNASASVQVTQATDVEGKATVVVTAENPAYSRTYTITFAVAKNNDANLTSIEVDGVLIEGFSSQTMLYRLTLPQGSPVPTVTYSLSDNSAIAEVISASSVPGTTTINVVAQDGTTRKTYTIRFDSEDDTRSTDATLSQLTLNGVGTWNYTFSPSRTLYIIVLPEGTTAVPHLTYQATDSGVTVQYVAATSVTGTSTITVTAENPDYQMTYKVQFEVEKNSDLTLSSLEVDGVEIEGFNPNILRYTVELPAGTTTIPTVTAVPSNSKQQIQIVNQKNELPTTAVVTVTAEDNSKIQYLVAFTIAKSNLSLLDMIYLDNVQLADFAPTKLTYYVDLGPATRIPIITVDKHNSEQTVEISTPRTNDYAYVRVISEDHSQTTVYTLHFDGDIILTPKQNPQLESLTVNNVAVAGFSPDTYEYDVLIDQDIDSWSKLIAYEANSDTRRVEIEKTDYVQNGECLLVLTSQDMTVTNVYKIHLLPQLSNDATLKSVSFNGIKYSEFLPYTLTYTSDIFVPVLTYEKQNGNQTVIYRELTDSKIELQVTAADGLTTNTYLFNFKSAQSTVSGDSDNGIESITIGSESKIFEPAFDFTDYQLSVGSTQTLWTCDLPEGVSELPAIDVVPRKSTSSSYVQTTFEDGKAHVQIQIVPEDRSWTDAYNVEVIFHKSKVGTLKSITYGSTTIEASDFPSDNIFNIPDLPLGADYPKVTYELGEEHQAVAVLDNESRQVVLSVQPQDLTVAPTIYVLNFKKGQSNNVLLNKLMVNGTEVGVLAEQTYSLPVGAPIPTVTYEAASADQNILQIDNGLKSTVVVVAEDGTYKSYTINFKHNASSVSELQDLQIMKGGSFVSIFADGVTNYDVELSGEDALQVPAIMPIPKDENATSTISYAWFESPTIIRVAAQDDDPAHVSTYTITFHRKKGSDATLKSVDVKGSMNFSFDDSQRVYEDIDLPSGATQHPEIVWEKNDPEQKIQYIDAGLGDVTKIIVTSADGLNSETYSFTFSKMTDMSLPNTLKSVLVEGHEVEFGTPHDDGLGNMICEGTVVLPLGIDNCNISYVSSYEGQTVLVCNRGVNNTSELKVMSNLDGVADLTYYVAVKTIVSGVNINGVAYEEFDPTVYDYVYVETGETQPTIEFIYPAEYKTLYPELLIETASNLKQSTLTLTSGTDEYVYTVSIYYKADDDKLNLDFESWENAKYYNPRSYSAAPTSHETYCVKPLGWIAPADCVEKYPNSASTYYSGEEVNVVYDDVKSGTHAVQLFTNYSTPIAASMPGVISLSNQTYDLNPYKLITIPESNVTYGDPITYRNTPDHVSIWHKSISHNRVTGWTFYMNQTSQTNQSVEISQIGNIPFENEWTEFSRDITYPDDYLPKSLDIRIGASDITPRTMKMSSMTEGISTSNHYTSKMYVDDLKFLYSSEIDGGEVLNTSGTVSVAANVITVDLDDATFIGLPQLKFHNAVPYYQHEILWNDDFTGGTVRSYAENKSYTDYTLVINNPNARGLKDILINNTSVWNGSDVINYTLPYGTTELPHIESQLRNHNQYQTMAVEKISKESYRCLIKLWNSKEDYISNPASPAKTYTLNFTWSNTDDATLKSIKSNGTLIDGFAADKTDYTLSSNYDQAFPTITYEKNKDGQQVTMTIDSISDTKQQVTLQVLAENKVASKTYVLVQQKTKPTNSFGTLQSVAVGSPIPVSDNMLTDKSDFVLPTSFVRSFPTDTVVETIGSNYIEWHISGAQQTHDYRLDFNSSGTLSNDMSLSKLSINSVDANIDQLVHTVKSLSGVRLQAVQNADGQTINATYDSDSHEFQISVQSPDKSEMQTYVVRLTSEPSSTALLESIVIEGYQLSEPLSDDQFEYNLISSYLTPIQAKNAVRKAPQVSLFDNIPSVQADAQGDIKDIQIVYYSDHIELEIFAEDDLNSNLYVFHIQRATEQPALDGITLFGIPLPGFAPDKYVYNDVWVLPGLGSDAIGISPIVGYQSTKKGQTVSVGALPEYPDGGTLQVTAELDGNAVTYQVAYVYDELPLSTNCLLAGLEVNGSALTNINDQPNPIFYVNDIMLDINPIRAENVQNVEVSYSGNTAVVAVTSQDGLSNNTYTIVFQPTVSTSNNTDVEIYLNGTLCAINAGQTVQYTVDDYANVTWLATEQGQTITRTNEGDDVVIDVTAPNGIDNAQYRLQITYNVPYTAELMTIRLDGQEFTSYTTEPYVVTPFKFVPQTTTYRIDILDSQTDTLPTIEAIKFANYQTLEWNTTWRPDGSQSDTLAVVQIKVGTPSSISETYQLTFVQAINTDASPADILFDNISMFDYTGGLLKYDSAQTNYSIELEKGAYVPSVSVLLKPNQDTLSVDRTSNLSGNPFVFTTTMVVRSQSGNSKPYTVTILLPQDEPQPEPCTDQLEDILIGGQSWNTLDGISRLFSADIRDYALTLPAGTPSFPDVEGYLSDPDNSCLAITEVVINSIDELNQEVVINIDSYDSNNDVTSFAYTIRMTIEQFDDATISVIYIGDEQIDIVDGTYNYTFTLPVGTRTYPDPTEVDCEMNENHAQVQVVRLDDSEDFDYNAFYQIHTTAQDGSTLDYYITFVVEKDSNADLEELVLIDSDGNQISLDDISITPEFDADQTQYDIVLPRGTQTLPDFSQSKAQSQYVNDLKIEKNMTSPTVGVVTITITAENGAVKQYVINVSVELSSVAVLDDIVLDITNNGTLDTRSVDNFDSRTTDYVQTLPYGINDISQVVITPVPAEGATFTINRGATLAETTYITVVAEDGIHTNTYSLVFDVQRSTNAVPLMIYLDGVAMDTKEMVVGDKTFYVDTVFTADYYEYLVILPAGSNTLPVVTAAEADDQQIIDVQTLDLITTVHVRSGSGSSEDYTIEFEIAKYDINTLDDLTIYGATLDGFRSDSNYYQISYPSGTLVEDMFAASDIAWTLTDSVSSTATLSQSDSLTWLVTVTAENGAQNVYIISVQILLSDNAMLDSLIVGGIMINNFDPEELEYTYYLYEGQLIPDIAAVPQDSDANVTILVSEIEEYTIVKVVAADDSTVLTYRVLFTYSDVNLSADAADEDVCIRHLGNGVYRASAARRNVQLCIYDISGHLLNFVNVPVIDANEELCESQTGVELTLEGNKTYIYTFYNNQKRKVTRGKIMYTE